MSRVKITPEVESMVNKKFRGMVSEHMEMVTRSQMINYPNTQPINFYEYKQLCEEFKDL